MLPYFIFDLLTWFEIAIDGYNELSVLQEQCEIDGVQVMDLIQQQRAGLLRKIRGRLVFVLLRIIQVLLVTAKLDGDLGSINWWLIFIPIWTVIGHQILQPMLKYRLTILEARQKKNATEADRSPSSQESPSVSIADVIYPLVGISVLASPYVLLSARLQSEHFSTLFIILPWLVLVRDSCVHVELTIMRLCRWEFYCFWYAA